MRRRLTGIVPTVLGVVILVFFFLHLVPGDPVEIMLGEAAMPADVAAMRHDLGLDLPLPLQLGRFLGGLVRGDLGYSIALRSPVATVIAERYPATLELAAAALLLAVLAGVPLGVVAAVYRGRAADALVRAASLIGVCVPSLWLGPLLILVFSMHLAWLPVSGRGSLAHLALPAVTLAAGMAAILVRLTRASVLATLDDAYVQTALAKGASRTRVLIRHVLRNALPPVTTIVGLQAGALLAGAIVTETIFSWPGLGRLVMTAIGARDYPLVQGCVLVIGCSYAVINALTDVVVTVIDPRAREDA